MKFGNSIQSGGSQGGHFSFQSPAALFRALTPKRWELLEKLQATGPTGVRARLLDPDVRRVHDDAHALRELGLIEKTTDGKLTVPRLRKPPPGSIWLRRLRVRVDAIKPCPPALRKGDQRMLVLAYPDMPVGRRHASKARKDAGFGAVP